MAVHLHRARRTDVLADGLAALLADPVADPFAEEVVVVPAKGVERWLTQRLSHRLGAAVDASDGVCAGVRFLNPRSLVALLTGTEDDDIWDPDRFVWPLLEAIDASLDEPWCRPLAEHLGHGVGAELGELRRERRYSVARRLAGLFASYAVQRPTVLAEWREGRDTDGAGAELPPDLTWQPPLWRALLTRVDAPPPDVRHHRAVAAIRDGAALALPDRLSMFGHTRLPVTELELLRALAEHREVHLWLPQASPVAWGRLAATASVGPVRRSGDHSASLVRNRLLASLGRDSRELQRSLCLLGQVRDRLEGNPGAPAPQPAPQPAPPPMLLRRLQDSVRDDEPGSPEQIAPGDRSVQVHACHGPARQVEVLREVLVGLLEDDPTLEPRDVLVMCPDIEAYAPLFSATFGLAEAAGERGHPGHRLRVRLADRGLRATNALLALAAALVRIAGGRASASEVLDLANSQPVRHRFGLDDDALAELAGWVRRAGVRWGLAADLREPFGLEGFEENTWRAGLDRVLLGVAAAEGGVFLGGRVPLDDVGSSRIELAGRLAELVDRLERTVRSLQGAGRVREWVEALRAGVSSLGSVPPSQTWQRAQLDRELDSILEAADTGSAPYAGRLRLADVRALLELRLAPRPTRANFRTGHLTVATLVPMRSVPHRVVCIVGLDDGAFPRSRVPDGDDVLQRNPVTGERDPRSEDRQLLLDAVLAAEETLVVTYTGASVHNNHERPPAVPLDEVLDALESLSPGARTQVVGHHPLQPFDPRNFDAPRPFSFDGAAAEAARAVQGPRRPPPPFLDMVLTRDREPDVQLDDLRRYFRHPTGGFLRQALDVGTPEDHEEPQDAMPVTLDSLEDWQVGDRILRRVLDLDDERRSHVLTAELLRGDLPPRRLGDRAITDVCRRVQQLDTASASDRQLEPTTVDVTLDLRHGRRLTGVVPDVRGCRIVRVHYSKLAPKHQLEAWIDLLALSAARPDLPWTAAVYGWSKKGRTEQPAWALLGPVDQPAPLLGALVDVRDRGLDEPLPLFARASPAWAVAVDSGKNPEREAGWVWRNASAGPAERDDPAHVRVFGGVELDGVLGQPRSDEDWNDQPTRLGRYAVHVWGPLLAHRRGENL